VGDPNTPLTSLTLSGASSNPSLVPNGNIVFGGSAGSRTVTVTPLAGQSGLATITVTVGDGELSASDSFVLTVNPGNQPPTITDIANQTIEVDTVLGPIGFTVGDPNTPLTSLTLSGASSNPSLVPDGNIVFGGSAGSRTVTVTPLAGQSGLATITVTVSDGELSASDSFVLTVQSAVVRMGSYTNSTTITIPSVGPASVYPSTTTVSGLSGPITGVTAVLRGFAHTYPSDVDVLLVGPSGMNVVLMSDTGGWRGVSSLNLAFSDLADQPISSAGPLVSGTFQPANYQQPADSFSLPAPSPPFGTGLSVFNGEQANGTWSLYVMDDGNGDLGSIVNGWSLTITTLGAGAVPPTISDLEDQYLQPDAVLGPMSFVVGDSDTPLANLVLSGTSSNQGLVPDANIVFGGSAGNRMLTVTPAAGQEGTTTITVTVSDGGQSASDTFVLTVATAVTGTASYTNATAIPIASVGPSTLYPSTIEVSGLAGLVSGVTAQLNGFGHTYPLDVDVMLVAPSGNAVLLMSDVGGWQGVSGLNLNFSNTATTAIPSIGPLVPGTYRPADYQPAEVFTAPAPPGPSGTSMSVFNGVTANGTWSLYVMDDGAGDTGSLTGGWSLTITTSSNGTGGLGSVELPARIKSVEIDVDGAIRLTVAGELGRVYALEASTDLIHWQTIQEATNESGELVFTDQAGGETAKFYRAVSIPPNGTELH